jgi:hypothetical protein
MRIIAEPWQAFITGPVYADADAPWRVDSAFATLCEFPGLRDSIGGRIAEPLIQAVGLVKAITQVDLLPIVQMHPRPQGLCLGFGMNALEPYDLLQVFSLAQVHGYEWIGEQVVEAAQTLVAFTQGDPHLSERIRLHHGTISDLSALPDGSIHVAYVGNVFTHEIPMTEETFSRAVAEILRVLAGDGILLSRGSSGVLEATLRPAGTLLLHNPLISVFQRQKRVESD